jgi:hypothetical protein
MVSVNEDNKDMTSSFFQGKLGKYSVELGDSLYIMKVHQQDDPELPALEFLSNQTAGISWY